MPTLRSKTRDLLDFPRRLGWLVYALSARARRRQRLRSDRRLAGQGSLPVKVVHLLYDGEITGVTRTVYFLVRRQMRTAGVEPSLVIAREQGPYCARFRALGLPMAVAEVKHLHDFEPLFRKRTFLEDHDLIHVHGRLQAAWPLLWAQDLPYVSHTQGLPMKYLVDPARKPTFDPEALFHRVFYRHAVENLSCSEFLASRLSELYRVDRNLFSVLHNVIDEELVVNEAEFPLPHELNGEFFVGTACRFVAFKMLHRLVRGFGEFLRRASLGDDVRLLMIGDGPDRDRLTNLTRKLPPQSYHFTGIQEKVYPWLDRFDVFVMPSRAEPFGISVVEAMALGKPVIVFSDVGGALEIVEHEKTGFVVSDSAELGKRLSELWSNEGLRRQMGEAGRRVVRQRFSIDRMASRLERIYREARDAQCPR